ncbi:uncharacterized protein LOC111389459 [Olea europaea var. sylvestris]|uniref:Tify domain-containing protein n=1 Tax=Olea europaea subsp. europaea TaxID=158383 RepID=A0A8S0SNV7_OLEEU|nr:uncharacterized protein LOC111389459 [Olea europaea var. sylvestris]XP_022870144.1 uncharacterized protein LOC111389459 [Olea europaea var. sylvestris]XP_022870145.1 uncharacterized protein LOC111389459 [Olea europaea var. sylvestris]CAA2994243.1 Hypothetical predicted protein [Olea europaea subsp. europaea]
MDKGFWMPKGGGPMTDGDAVFGNLSSMEPKRGRQWFSDAAEPELIPNKKQTVESPIVKPAAGISMSNALHWDYSSGFHSVPNQFIDRLFGPETTRSVNLTERNMSTVGTDGLNMRKKFVDEQFGNDSSVGLSISYGIEDPETCISYGGIRKVKVNQVKDSENGLLASLEQNVGISMDQTYSRGSTDTFISMGQPYGSGDANMRSVSSNSRKGNDHVTLMSHSYDKGETNTISFGGYQDESVLDALARPIGSYSLLYEQSSDQTSEIPSKKAVDVQNANITMSTSQAPKSRPDSTSKNKSETKPSRKEAPNSFPSNVRSLIATNILDGVPVRYVSVSREELRGIIQGSGYLCGCQTCEYSKTLNAYEFERHAGCKTKHPNNHIYFENGKTIYQIVQELRSTPESMLFDAIQTVTGSPINQKAFRIWKESFQAATRELQRIYGKEALNL